MNDRGNSLTLKTCDDCAWLRHDLSLTLRRTSRELTTKNGWVRKAPWRLSEAEDVEQAKICLDQLRSLPDEKRYALKGPYFLSCKGAWENIEIENNTYNKEMNEYENSMRSQVSYTFLYWVYKVSHI